MITILIALSLFLAWNIDSVYSEVELQNLSVQTNLTTSDNEYSFYNVGNDESWILTVRAYNPEFGVKMVHMVIMMKNF